MPLFESGEMYLETLLLLFQKLPHVRSLDLAETMNYSKPSVSRAVGILKTDGYILVDDNGYITFTAKGKTLANKIYDRHVTLSKLLERLGVDDKTATEDACRIEHVISDKSFKAIKNFAKNYPER